MTPRIAKPQPPSPFDAFLVRFLRSLENLPDGYSPTTDARQMAVACDVLPAFVDPLFVSARTRGLVEPFRARSARGRFRWQVSVRGRQWLSGQDHRADDSGVGSGGAAVADD